MKQFLFFDQRHAVMMGLQTNRIEVIGRMGIPIGNQMLRAAISVIGFPLAFMQAALSQYEGDKHKPQGELVRVGPRSLHAIVSGKSNPACPTVVLEAGMGGCALDWSLVQPKLSTYTKVLSYDRAGFGWSTGILERPTCKHYVEDLRGLLSELKLTPPYLLVGHSYGGMIMRMFAAEYPDEIAGIVLVDATHEGRFLEERLDSSRKTLRNKHRLKYKLGYLLSTIGVPRMVRQHVGTKRLPVCVQKHVTAMGYRSSAYRAAYLEYLHVEESAAQLGRSRPLRADMPIAVLTAANQTEDWLEGQKVLLQLSKETQHTIVEDSWHAIQIHKPQAVIDAVVRLLNALV